MMISVYLKDSVLTTQSSTNIVDLKPKMEKLKISSMKNVCDLFFSRSQCNSRTCF